MGFDLRSDCGQKFRWWSSLKFEGLNAEVVSSLRERQRAGALFVAFAEAAVRVEFYVSAIVDLGSRLDMAENRDPTPSFRPLSAAPRRRAGCARSSTPSPRRSSTGNGRLPRPRTPQPETAGHRPSRRRRLDSRYRRSKSRRTAQRQRPPLGAPARTPSRCRVAAIVMIEVFCMIKPLPSALTQTEGAAEVSPPFVKPTMEPQRLHGWACPRDSGP